MKIDLQKDTALNQLLHSVLRGVRLFLVYMMPAVVLAVISSPELRDMLAENPQLAVYAPLINVVLIALADQIKRHLDERSIVYKAL